MKSNFEKLEEYFKNTPREQIEKDWKDCEEDDKIGVTMTNFLNINKMSRTRQLLEEQFVDGEWEELMSNLNTDISPSIYRAMELYAIECCEATQTKIENNILQITANIDEISIEDFEKINETIEDANNIILV